jgi:coenzyme F420-reducing hydrogenase alpha subunit
MSGEGRIEIVLGGKDGVRLHSSRKLGLPRLFAGKKLADVVGSIGLLFPICGQAHAVAAVRAAEAACGVDPDEETEILRSLLVLSETWREHALRMRLDWPKFVNGLPDRATAAEAMRRWEDLRTLIDPHRRLLRIGGRGEVDQAALLPVINAMERFARWAALGEAHAAIASADVAGFDHWIDAGSGPAATLLRAVRASGWGRAGAVPVAHLPHLAAGELRVRLLGEASAAFVAAPDWQGQTFETGPLARQAAHPIVAREGCGMGARLVARLVEFAHLPSEMRALISKGGHSATADQGVAQLEAARGRLVHAVETDGETVHRYAILAPTEWNFHPAGAAARGLASIAQLGRDAIRCAELFALAVDPCVAVSVRAG